MRYALFFLFIIITSAHAADDKCFSRDDVLLIKNIFIKNDRTELANLATDSARGKMFSDQLYGSARFTLTNISEVFYGWGEKRKDFDAPSDGSIKYPNQKVCVWELEFSLPEKIRKLCDDDGIYGYGFNFRKNKGHIEMYDFNADVEYIGDSLACKAANSFLLLGK